MVCRFRNPILTHNTPKVFAILLIAALASQSFQSILSPLLAAPTTTPAPTPKRTIVVLGDSLAAAYGLDPAFGFVALVQKRIDSQNLPFTVVNAGVSGDTTAGGLRRIDWLLKRPVDVLILELGGNDGLRGIPPASTRTNLQAIIQKTRARYPTARIVLAGMQMPPNMGESFAKEFREIYPELSKSLKTALIPFLLENVGGIAELNQPDQIHPTAKGHEIVATNVWKTLEPVLLELTAPAPAP